MTYNVLQIPQEFLVQIWLLSHAAWEDFKNFQERKKGIEIPPGKGVIAEAETAAREISTGKEPVWPSQIPKFQEIKEGVEAKAVREMFAMAVAWAIAHEMKHAKLYDDPARPDDRTQEELMCDDYASDFLFARIEEYSALTGEAESKVRGKRAISALIGLYFVAKLSVEAAAGSHHPSVKDRIKLLFDSVGSKSLEHFWDFSVAIICELNPAIANKKIKEPNPTSRDLAYIALECAFH